jgi:glucose/arabinose dehydrogenase/mono/diheme cytochrome c family protein
MACLARANQTGDNQERRPVAKPCAHLPACLEVCARFPRLSSHNLCLPIAMSPPFERLLILVSLLLASISVSATFPPPDADNGSITLPPGFRATVFADNLVVGRKSGRSAERLRGIAVMPNGDVYAKTKFGPIFALRDTDHDGRADVVQEFGPGDGGTHITLHEGWLYHSTRTTVYRQRYTLGELVPTSPVEVVIRDLPAERDHDAKAFAFDNNGHILVEIGSPYNVFSEGDRRLGATGKTDAEVTAFQETYGGFWQFDATRLNQTQADGKRFATGHRHAVCLAWNPISQAYFMVQMGRDNLNVVDPVHYDALDNAERVSEVMHVVRAGSNFGWPYTYWDPIKQAHLLAPEYGGNNFKRVDPNPYDRPVVAFPAHWAPLGITFYSATQFPEKYRHGAFVAFHGSWNRAPRAQAGYQVAFVPFDDQGMPVRNDDGSGRYETFADGFAGATDFTSTRDARYRPAGVAVGPDGSLYISETEKGRIWRVFYTGESASTASLSSSATPSPTARFSAIDGQTPGGQVYAQICAACHMTNGSGVPGMQPALMGNATVAGDADKLVRVILEGPAAVLPADREKFPVVMPAFGTLYDDATVASLANFLRTNFAPGTPKVTPADVTRLRTGQ